MPTLVEVETHALTRGWHAAVVILTAAFPHDRDVWSEVKVGETADLSEAYLDPRRPLHDRVLLACAQGFTDGRTMVPVGQLVALPDSRLRLVLDALAIARGSLPID